MNHWGDASVEHGGHVFGQLGSRTGSTRTQSLEAKQHESANHFAFYRRTNTGGVRTHQRLLQLHAIFWSDVAVGKRTKACADAINRGLATGQRLDVATGGTHAI
jgi:hypothetical protein